MTTPLTNEANNSPILVIGAGVLGLSTARQFQSQFPKREITILAAELPSDFSFSSSSSSSSCSCSSSASSSLPSSSYASAWAGAHYRPIFPATAQLEAEFELAGRTFEVMKRMAREVPESGVKIVTGVEYLDCPGQGELAIKDGDVYAGPGDGFRVLRSDELVKGARWGCEYQTYCVNVLVYCRFLLQRFRENGGKVIVASVGCATEAFDVAKRELGAEVPTVVNCSGSNFGQDPKMAIIRGQTCLVKNPYHKTVTRQYKDGRWATLIPRPLNGGTVVGVSKEMGDREEMPRPETRQLLLQQSIECFPDFVQQIEDFEVIRDDVGRRPFREEGLRIEVQELQGGKKRILHGYGAGGRGYELSWGIAQRLVQLLGRENVLDK